MKFRKKPIVIDAEQFLTKGKLMGEVIDLCVRTGVSINGYHPHAFQRSKEQGDCNRSIPRDDLPRLSFTIGTLENTAHEVTEGCWVITGVEGERYVCQDRIFRKTYEAVCPYCLQAGCSICENAVSETARG
jgi:hypothetical protein